MLRHSTFLFLVVQAMQRVADSFDIQHISNVLNLDRITIEISYIGQDLKKKWFHAKNLFIGNSEN